MGCGPRKALPPGPLRRPDRLPTSQGMEPRFTLRDIARVQAGLGPDGVEACMRGLQGIGVAWYQTCLCDGHSEYFGCDGAALRTPPLYAPQPVAPRPDREAACRAMAAHGRGESDYLEFMRALCAAGVARWVMDPARMTCTCQSEDGEAVLVDDL